MAIEHFRGVASIRGPVLFNDKMLVGDRVNGKIYALNPDTYTDNGSAITRIRRAQIINKERVNVIHHKIEINFQTGVGLASATCSEVEAAGDDPQATLKWSDDGGNTWSDGISIAIG